MPMAMLRMASPIPTPTRSVSMVSATTRSPPNGRGPASSTCSRNCSAGMAENATGALSESEAAKRLKALANEIARHDKLYHDQDAPEVSDAEYDALMRENRELEEHFPELVRADSPSKRLGAAPTTGLAKVAHARPMLSIENAFSDVEVIDFVARVRRFLALPPEELVAITAEPKIDGLSCSLRYDNGELVLAA